MYNTNIVFRNKLPRMRRFLAAFLCIAFSMVSLTGWGVMDTFLGVDGDRISQFFEAYAGNLGPEGGIPC